MRGGNVTISKSTPSSRAGVIEQDPPGEKRTMRPSPAATASPSRARMRLSMSARRWSRSKNRGRLDFWTLGNEIAGRSRRYRRVVIDEAAFAKNGDNKVDGSMMEIWEKAIKPTLFDYGGEVLICSNSAGKNPDNFFYHICTDPNYGFGEFHVQAVTRVNAEQASKRTMCRPTRRRWIIQRFRSRNLKKAGRVGRNGETIHC